MVYDQTSSCKQVYLANCQSSRKSLVPSYSAYLISLMLNSQSYQLISPSATVFCLSSIIYMSSLVGALTWRPCWKVIAFNLALFSSTYYLISGSFISWTSYLLSASLDFYSSVGGFVGSGVKVTLSAVIAVTPVVLVDILFQLLWVWVSLITTLFWAG